MCMVYGSDSSMDQGLFQFRDSGPGLRYRVTDLVQIAAKIALGCLRVSNSRRCRRRYGHAMLWEHIF